MEKLNLFQKINKIMLIVEAIQKESKKVNGQYTYVSHDAVAKALHMPMANLGIVMVPSVVEMTQDGNRTTAKVEVTFVNADDPSERQSVICWGYGIDTQDKGPGKAISYAVKYALLKTFCLETGDDVEKDNIEYKPNATPGTVIPKAKESKKEELSSEELDEYLKRWGKNKEMFRKFLLHVKDRKKMKTLREAIEAVQENEEQATNTFNSWLQKQAA